MTRSAIFVDAGYLFAQGSAALAGHKQPRTILKLNATAVIAELKDLCASKTGDCDLLRIYWYDGANSSKGPTLEQSELAHTDGVKLRLGFINSSGQQKGVDSLIVTDLIDLARNHAICDAVVLSGDEDVRIGVQIAQQFGVRVHLLGIVPIRGSQSRQLQQEADTTTEWNKATVEKFLQLTAQPTPKAATEKLKSDRQQQTPGETGKLISEYVKGLEPQIVTSLKTHWLTLASIPPEYDGPLLGKCRDCLGRELTPDERKSVRAYFKSQVRDRE